MSDEERDQRRAARLRADLEEHGAVPIGLNVKIYSVEPRDNSAFLVRFVLSPWDEELFGKPPNAEIMVTEEALEDGFGAASIASAMAERVLLDLTPVIRAGVEVVELDEKASPSIVLCPDCGAVQQDDSPFPALISRCHGHACTSCPATFSPRQSGRPG